MELAFDKKSFLRDGKEHRILSGAIHYFRVVPEYWEDRLKKLKACGFNTVETYACWNLHEPQEGAFDFSGRLDLDRFLTTASGLGLDVILRPGPYICAEWEFGGLPYWLLKEPRMRLRCNDALYLSKVRRYYTELFSRIRHHLACNGGRIGMVQVENEYGSYGNDQEYLQSIVSLYRELGVDVLLFTSDGPSYTMLSGGMADGCLATVNFGSRPIPGFELLRELRPDQPAMCMEFWNGWFDHWHEEHHARGSDDTVRTLDEILSYGASVNFYMFHGGTNFGFTNGANYGGAYQPAVTSYDYDAPLTEAGDLTEKYYGVKRVLEKHFGKAPETEVSNTPKRAYGTVGLPLWAPLLEQPEAAGPGPVTAPYPLTMEEAGQAFGFILYSCTLKGPGEELPLVVEEVRDRALIFVGGEYRGVQNRCGASDEILLKLGAGERARLDILVENMGRVNYGEKLRDRKGILGGVRLGYQYQFGWTIYPLPLSDLGRLRYGALPADASAAGPGFLKGVFTVKEKGDSFLRLDGFRKGAAFINGFNLGRYWNEAGPQKTLYVPAPLLREGENELVVFELHGFERPEALLLDAPCLG